MTGLRLAEFWVLLWGLRFLCRYAAGDLRPQTVQYASIAFYLLRFRDRLQMQTLLQQMIMIFATVVFLELVRTCTQFVTGQP